MPESTFPEHEKLRAVREQSQSIGEFLDWLKGSCHINLMTWMDAGDNGEPRYIDDKGVPTDKLTSDRIRADRGTNAPNPAFEEWDEGWVHVRMNNNELLAEYFEIDLNALELEKKAMLELVRKQNAERDPHA